MKTRWGTVPVLIGFILAAQGARAESVEETPEVASGAVSAEAVEYRDGATRLRGYRACGPSIGEKRPGVLIVHEWWGLNPYAKRRARQLAELGYVAFAADMYGGGQVADKPDVASKLAGQLRSDRAAMRRRAAAALAALKDDPRVDPNRIVAIGYCFGGTCVLELARSGADLAGVVAFHGGLDTPQPDSTPRPNAAILVCHGAADPSVSPEQLDGFRREMNRCGADWQLNMYGQAVHGFTNPDSRGPSGEPAYQAAADERAWADMLRFFARTIK